MVLTNRWLLTGVVGLCFGALACSDEPASFDYGMDGGPVRTPVDGDEDEEDDDSTGKPKKDGGAKKDAGAKDGGAKDGGKDAGVVRGIDAGVVTGGDGDGDGDGPSVVGATRDPNPAPSIADSNGVPAIRTERCPSGASMAQDSAQTVLLEGCCLASGQCGFVPTLPAYRTTCVTLAEAEQWVRDENKEMKRVTLPSPATCSNASGN